MPFLDDCGSWCLDSAPDYSFSIDSDLLTESPSTSSSDPSLPNTIEWDTVPLPPLPSSTPSSTQSSCLTFEFYSYPQSQNQPSPQLLPEGYQSGRDDYTRKQKRSERLAWSSELALHDATSHLLRPVMNSVTKVWSCPTCNDDFSGYYEAMRHITLRTLHRLQDNMSLLWAPYQCVHLFKNTKKCRNMRIKVSGL